MPSAGLPLRITWKGEKFMKFNQPENCQPGSHCKNKVSYRLYLVSDQRVLKGRDFIESLEQAILGGVTVLQLRDKEASSKAFYQWALEVKKLTEKYRIPLIINDRIDIALAVDAEGVHLGQQDLPIKAARRLMGPQKILGASTATLEEAKKAEAEGADYIGVGALFPTETKSNTRRVSLEQLKLIKNSVSIPVVGIGGISEDNLSSIIQTGVDGVAVVSALLGKEDIQRAAKNLTQFFLTSGGNHS